jgi:catechol 2,3-dioxygenase-like lactoylglutathione lyase family enzyme
MLTYVTLHHAAVAVTDLIRAKQFYGGVLGLKEIPRPAFSFDGAWYRAGDRDIHLIVVVGDPSVNRDRKLDMADGHLALRVTSFAEAQAHLESAGVPMRVTIGGPTGFPQIHIMDPDRNIIEINAAE